MGVSESVRADQFVTSDRQFFSMLFEIGDIILELGGCQGWALTSTLPPMHSRDPNQTS